MNCHFDSNMPKSWHRIMDLYAIFMKCVKYIKTSFKIKEMPDVNVPENFKRI